MRPFRRLGRLAWDKTAPRRERSCEQRAPVVEPVLDGLGRGTAICIGRSTRWIRRRSPVPTSLVVRPSGERNALVYIPPIKGSIPTVEVYAEAAEAESRAAAFARRKACRLSDQRRPLRDWMRGLVARSAPKEA